MPNESNTPETDATIERMFSEQPSIHTEYGMSSEAKIAWLQKFVSILTETSRSIEIKLDNLKAKVGMHAITHICEICGHQTDEDNLCANCLKIENEMLKAEIQCPNCGTTIFRR